MRSFVKPLPKRFHQLEPVRLAAPAWRFIKTPSRLRGHATLLLAIALLVFLGSWHSASAGGATVATNTTDDSSANTLTDPTATLYIAANVANTLNLPMAEEINKQAAAVALASVVITEDSALTKPVVVSTEGETSHIMRTYLVKKGDTLAKIADAFGVSQDTITWANNLDTGVELLPNTELRVPPIDGVLYTVQKDDTVKSLSDTYNATTDEIVNYNDLELTGLVPGERIFLPGGKKPAPTITYASVTPSLSSVFVPTFGGNGYGYGFCTWYVATRVSVPSDWGNANTWDDYARLTPGWKVSAFPRVGAIAQTDAGWGGHVAYVEAVSPDGTKIKYSDMNGLAGWGHVGYSGWVPATDFPNYIYH